MKLDWDDVTTENCNIKTHLWDRRNEEEEFFDDIKELGESFFRKVILLDENGHGGDREMLAIAVPMDLTYEQIKAVMKSENLGYEYDEETAVLRDIHLNIIKE